jgi:WD40 repeat protein
MRIHIGMSFSIINLSNSLINPFYQIGHDDWVRDVFFCPDGSSLLSVGDDKSIRLWDSATGKEEIILYQCHSLPINKIILHHSMPILATASADKTVKLWKF